MLSGAPSAVLRSPRCSPLSGLYNEAGYNRGKHSEVLGFGSVRSAPGPARQPPLTLKERLMSRAVMARAGLRPCSALQHEHCASRIDSIEQGMDSFRPAGRGLPPRCISAAPSACGPDGRLRGPASGSPSCWPSWPLRPCAGKKGFRSRRIDPAHRVAAPPSRFALSEGLPSVAPALRASEVLPS